MAGDARRQDAGTRRAPGDARGAAAGGWLLPCLVLLAVLIALPSPSRSEEIARKPQRPPVTAQHQHAQPTGLVVRHTASSPLITPLLFPAAAPDKALPDSPANTVEPLDIDWGREPRRETRGDTASALSTLPALRWDTTRLSMSVTRMAFPQWSSVLAKNWGWDASFDEACDKRVGRPCHLRDWQGFLESLDGQEREAQLAAVNRRINLVEYRADSGTWGDMDYWAAPGEFFANGGDCEDYAIAKYYSLRALGFAAEQMWIVVLQDLARRQPHAVLVVAHDGAELVLDNLNDQVLGWSALPAYRPYYSVNEVAYWLHGADDPS